MKKPLDEIYKEFGESLKDIADHALGKMIGEYVPFAETDYDMNVMYRSEDLIRNFLEGKSNPEWLSEDHLFRTVLSEKVRKKILENYREELIDDLNQDHLKEIESLKIEIKHLKNTLYNRI